MNQQRIKHIISKTNFDAVIFDLDGVVVSTVNIHMAAWKKAFDEFLALVPQNKPFNKQDYLLYVDGKPRFDGVKSFLQSRGIDLPEGKPEDAPGMHTMHALGALKNGYFKKYIKERGIKVYPSTISLIRSLKSYSFKTAIISSSKNCSAILQTANISDIFDVKVDGIDAEKMGIKGKPAPDIFLEAARQLEVKPKRAVVVEDATSGVRAGRSGNFGLIIGVDRGGNHEALFKNGADMVVSDLSEINVYDKEEKDNLPSALKHLKNITTLGSGKRIAVFLDYDGTLTPIVETPDKAILSEEMKQTIVELSKHCMLAIISGRDLRDVKRIVGIDSIIYAGSHGFEIAGPKGLHVENQIGIEFLPILDIVEKKLFHELSSIQGVLVERKKFTIAVHYRLVEEKKVNMVEKVVDKILKKHSELRKGYGKKVFELQPKIKWDKGKALLWLFSSLKLDINKILTIYIGDDITDEDVFKAIRKFGIGILVCDKESPTSVSASYMLKNTDEVREFLLNLIQICKKGEG